MKKDEKQYYDWLLGIIAVDDPPAKDHNELTDYIINMLYNIPFQPILDLDNNRVEHVYDIRREHGFDYILKEPSVLEVMVTMAISCEDEIMTNDYWGDRTSVWFWAMYDNLGLDYVNSLEEAEDIIFDFMNRYYDSKGNGSIFKTYKNVHDFRELDLWWQMQIWLTENYADEVN